MMFYTSSETLRDNEKFVSGVLNKETFTLFELVDIIKRLASLPTYQRERIEGKITEYVPFFSGLISYSKEPVKEAIELYEEHRDSWLLSPKGKRHPNVIKANVMIEMLQK